MRITCNQCRSTATLIIFTVAGVTLNGQALDSVPLKPWAAPLYFDMPDQHATETKSDRPLPTTAPVGSLVFVAVPPCRVVDTRGSGLFPTPNPIPGTTSRTFTPAGTCGLPSAPMAYSFNVTVVPPGPLAYLTIWPTGITMPVVSTLNSLQGQIVANAAIVPAGTNGAVDVYVSNTTHVIIDVNGYYAPMTAITLARGTGAAPALNFDADSGTGIYSSGAGNVSIASNGVARLQVRNDGDIDLTGNIRQNGQLLVHNTAQNNLSVGLNTNMYGGGNTAIGTAALSNNGASGYYNTTIGYNALGSNTSGSSNTAIGAVALFAASAGLRNVAIGHGAGGNLITGSDNTYLNNPGNSESGTMRLGDPVYQNRAFLAGVRGVTTGSANAVAVVVDSFGQLGTLSSSRRFKTDIHDMGDNTRALMSLRPVTFRYKGQTGEDGLEYGLIAEEVAEVLPDLVVRGKDGEIETVQYHKLHPLLLRELQKQRAEIESLKALVEKLLARH